MGKAPILIDDRLPKGEQVLAESALILSYLLKAYDSKAYFYPAAANPNEQANDKVWRDYTFLDTFCRRVIDAAFGDGADFR